jgi:hypothetical protein
MNTIKCCVLCLLLGAAFATAQQTAPSTDDLNFTHSGNDFLRVCEPPSKPLDIIRGACQGYVIGVLEGAVLGPQSYCPGPNVTSGQTYRIVVKFINDHPEESDHEARILIVDAAVSAFPCHPNK